MGTPTYTLISETVLGSSATSVTLSSIPSTYKDVIVELAFGLRFSADGTATVSYQFNSDTGSNYSMTEVSGNGTSAASTRNSSQTAITQVVNCSAGTADTVWQTQFVNLQSYANTSINKTAIIRTNGITGNGAVRAAAGLWRSSAAISSVVISQNATQFYPGTVVRLWGIVG